ncbi:glycoside hydrolase family 26 protein [Asanoa iriomotensis]|uniref:GH26 domain-containing protein n=1 Tax=Asanoa iriomotensis TaxID=234613 RepID=A0ABQ4C7Q4_9ACTN|nr:glycosyl hydrolase [Asanoa iriomotensis]GIF58803.1 hypothetical protein Air01nite_48980 [Asanoa iriomotensis]
MLRGRRTLTVTVSVAAALAAVACGGPSTTPPPPAGGGPTSAAAPTPDKPVVADAGDILGDRPLFGVMLKNRTPQAVDAIERSVDCRPSVVKVFTSVQGGISARTLEDLPGTPLLSLEPWTTGRNQHQPEWKLGHTLDGTYDDQYAEIARAVVAYRKPILIRWAHEMNGHWYPWGTDNDNRPGEYPAAFRRVVKLFRDLGATNAVWVWAPNIVRGTASGTIKEFWPGADYVDVVGPTGYAIRESSPSVTFRDTLDQIYALTDKPVLLTEVGVEPGPQKRAWLAAFGPWLRENPRIAGFVWNQVNRDGRWSFDDTPADLVAFRTGLARSGVAC